MTSYRNPVLSVLLAFCILLPISGQAAQLLVGAATADITPEGPVALSGQRHLRVSETPASRIYATVLALEAVKDGRNIDSAIMVSCDLVAIRGGVLEKTREKVAIRIEGFDTTKLFMNATHTHTGPVSMEGKYTFPDGVMKPAEFVDWATDRIAEAVEKAWNSRAPGKVAWGQSQAVIAHNRRPFYANGTAKMYGKTNRPDFRGIEAYEDHDLDVLFFWNETEELIATAINVPCPSQEIESTRQLHADFWDPVRRRLRGAYGENLHILGWTGASGDVVSRPIYGKAADERMRRLRGNLTRLEEVSRRIVVAWEDAYEASRHDMREEVKFAHRVENIALPYRLVTEEEYEEAKSQAKKYKGNPEQVWNYRWHHKVVERYEEQQSGKQGPYVMELHALRLGDVAIATNDFELYTEFGIRMKARSPAIQTFLIQLTGPGTYLPTERAVELGSYGAVIQSIYVGPLGGQVLVDKTVQSLKAIWEITDG